MGVKSLVKKVLIEQQNKKYARLLASKKMTYDQWIRDREKSCDWKQQSMHHYEMTKVSEKDEREDFVCFLMPGGQMAQGAMVHIAQCFAEHPEVSILYGDEDIMEPEGSLNAGVRRSPWFKPDWSPDLLKDSFYFGGLTVLRKSLWEQMTEDTEWSQIGATVVEDVPRFHSFIRKCVRQAGGYAKNSRAVMHVRQMLYHSYSEAARDKYVFCEESKDNKEYAPNDSAKDYVKLFLSIIIPSKDNPDILKKCLQAIPQAAGNLAYEVIIVDNGSCDENRQRIEQLVNQCNTFATKDSAQAQAITYLYRPMEFHFSKMCNLGAEAAKGKLLLFLNDDVELAQAASLEKMAVLAAQEYTGAVGVKLYYPDSVRIQHAGITNLPMGPVHKLQFLEDREDYYFGYNQGLRNVLAVTAACLMVEKDKFCEIGGFAEELRVAFNDVDLCFKLYEQGYHNVCCNDCFAYHHESLSRGDDESADKLKRLLAERDKLYERNPQLLGKDPYYSAGLGRDGLDTRIRPAYETAGNKPQIVTEMLQTIHSAEYRQDNCLLFRVEDSRNHCVQGYGVVLGDNNACYDRWLVLKDNKEKCYAVALEGQYRPDLEENMQDQVNVGLSGIWTQLRDTKLSAGTYLLGMAVKNRVTGLKLINWSNRSVEI